VVTVSVTEALADVIRGLGTLRGAQKTLAATAQVLAGQLDEGRGVTENVAREFRITVAALAGSTEDNALAAPDSISTLQDEVAIKRRQKEA
jgi:hypothetical protein